MRSDSPQPLSPAERRPWVREPFVWALAALLLLSGGMPWLKPVFAALFPELARPLYEQDRFLDLLAAHLQLVIVSSGASIVLGVAAGVFVTRRRGREFRPLVESLMAMGQTVPPVAVLALAVPVMGFGEAPALLALALYGVLPIAQGTVAGIASVPAAAHEAATGLGMNDRQVLRQVELPLAAPVILAGIRTSVIINIGTAAIASTVGAKTLGLPIIVGLSGYNTAYVLQGAMVLGLLAVVVDLGFERLAQKLGRWRQEMFQEKAAP